MHEPPKRDSTMSHHSTHGRRLHFADTSKSNINGSRDGLLTSSSQNRQNASRLGGCFSATFEYLCCIDLRNKGGWTVRNVFLIFLQAALFGSCIGSMFVLYDPWRAFLSLILCLILVTACCLVIEFAVWL